jgi:hypothetical protein
LGTIQEIADGSPSPWQIALTALGTESMTLDIAKFHRTCPILPEHKPWFVCQGLKGFYMDHICPFGGSSSSSNAGMVGNATVDIWVSEGISPICKYKDDLNIFHYPIPKANGSLTFTYD